MLEGRSNSFIPADTQAIKDNLETLRSAMKRLKKELENYIRVASAAIKGDYLDAVTLLQPSGNPSLQLARSLAATAEVVVRYPLTEYILDAVRQLQLHYRELLEQRIDKEGLPRIGEWPNYFIREVVRLDIDLERSQAKVNGRKLRTFEPVRVVEQVKAAAAEMLDRPFDPIEFLSMIRTAHERVASNQGRGLGDFTDIRAIFSVVRTAMKSSGRDNKYSEPKFRVDLYRLHKEKRPVTDDSQILELSPAQSASRGMYIPSRDGGNYIAALRFVRAHRNDR